MRPRSSKPRKPELVDIPVDAWRRDPRFERVYGACCPDSPINHVEQAIGVLRMLNERIRPEAVR
jgi:hypothetical protein